MPAKQKEDFVTIPVERVGPGRSGRTPAARRGLLKRKLRGGKQNILKQAVAKATS